jgi:hypothetical protein
MKHVRQASGNTWHVIQTYNDRRWLSAAYLMWAVHTIYIPVCRLVDVRKNKCTPLVRRSEAPSLGLTYPQSWIDLLRALCENSTLGLDCKWRVDRSVLDRIQSFMLMRSATQCRSHRMHPAAATESWQKLKYIATLQRDLWPVPLYKLAVYR